MIKNQRQFYIHFVKDSALPKVDQPISKEIKNASKNIFSLGADSLIRIPISSSLDFQVAPSRVSESVAITSYNSILSTAWGVPSSIKINLSDSDENKANENRRQEFSEAFDGSLLAALRVDPIQPGEISQADFIIEQSIQKNRLVALEWIEDLFIKNYNNPDLASNLLLLIGRLPFEVAYPVGPTMVLAGIAHKNDMVKEASLRACEHWSNIQTLQLLDNVSLESDWLKDYLEAIKQEIKMSNGTSN